MNDSASQPPHPPPDVGDGRGRTTPPVDATEHAGAVALVTGSTSGIGEATAHALARRGATVVVTGRRVERGEAVAEAIRAAGGRATFVPADIVDGAAVDRLVRTVVDTHGRLDIAVNNAGIFDRMHEVHTYGDDAWDEMLAVNLTAVFRSMRAEIAAMIDTGGGVIVNNASTVAHRGSTRASPGYVASKHAVLGLTRQAAVQYAARGIRVVAVSPGPTRTEVADALVAEGPDAVAAALAGLNPMVEFVTPDQVAATVAFLCSRSAAMINGVDVVVDGGQTAQL